MDEWIPLVVRRHIEGPVFSSEVSLNSSMIRCLSFETTEPETDREREKERDRAESR